ncbi:MAG: SgcJ/EcaC family oxidoreductase [Gammaproteobacteria bacterium]|nr:SgcJ/EcaC family oxidoreductase [Gammaproteobacteria bacterium]
MRNIAIIIAAAVWLALPIAVLAEDAMDQKPIDEANAKLEALQKDGDTAGMAEMYTEDAILLPTGGPRTEGRDAIEAFWEGMLGSGVENVQLTTEDLVAVADDLAYEIGRYTATPANADPISGQYLVLWKRVGDEWKLHVDIFNEDRKGP